MARLLSDWDGIRCRRVQLLSGENKREFVLTAEEEAAYLSKCSDLIRAIAIIMLDCGLRPEEVHRLKWEQYRDGFLTIYRGKGAVVAAESKLASVSARCSRLRSERLKMSSRHQQRPGTSTNRHTRTITN